MPFSLMNGLSAAGAAVSQTAGTEALNLQKAGLEQQRDVLASQLATQSGLAVQAPRLATETSIAAGQEQSGQAIAGMQVAGALERTKQEIAGQLQAAKIGAASAATVAGIQTGSQQKIATMGATSIQFDPKTNQPFIFNPISGETKPMPSVVNMGLVKLSQGVINQAQEQMRAETMDFAAQATPIRQQITNLAKSPILMGDQAALDKAEQPYLQQLRDLTMQHNSAMAALNSRIAGALAPLFIQGATAADLPAAGAAAGASPPANRPPLSSIIPGLAPPGP